MSASVNVTDAMVHAFEDAYCKNWEAQRNAPEGAQELGTFFATRAGLSAALSAQPSRGGQDVLAMIGSNLRSILSLCKPDGQSISKVDAANIQHEARHALQLLDLAARQPVGEPLAVIENGAFGGGGLLWIGPMPPIGTKLYAAPTAQAVGLGQFRDLIEFLIDRCDSDLTTEQFLLAGRLLNTIDSQT